MKNFVSQFFSYRALKFLVTLISILGATAVVANTGVVDVGRFSKHSPGETMPNQWKPLRFKKIERMTDYVLVRDGGTAVVQARAQASASGLIREITIDPKTHPLVQWRWKVANTLEAGNVHSKKGDDYPARIYITFAYDPKRVGFFERAQYEAIKLLYGEYPPLRSINYIWESHAPIGTQVANAYTDRVRMIVVQSGTQKLHQWVVEERNVYEDYRQVFGEDPPSISGVAIMTDTDNTGESATAWYGDIIFKPLVSRP